MIYSLRCHWSCCSFCFNYTATTVIYTYVHTLSLHGALPIYPLGPIVRDRDRPAILDGARAGRRALRWRLHIVVQIVETVRPAARRAATTLDRKSTRLNSSH